MIFSRILYKRLYFHHQKILIGIMFIIFIIQFFITFIIDNQFIKNNFNFIIYGLIFNISFAFQNSFERYIIEIFDISYKPVPYILMYQSLFSFIIYYIYFYYSGKLILEVNLKEYIFNLIEDTTNNFGMDKLRLIFLLCSIFIFNYSKFIYNIYISSCDWMLMENIHYFIISIIQYYLNIDKFRNIIIYFLFIPISLFYTEYIQSDHIFNDYFSLEIDDAYKFPRKREKILSSIN